ncbi:MAG: hypothetical protein AMJ54_01595 [Deltaproteobacteria bacterium SG8_13]|nr:MAG: hypothetical protein AMJ54_01595 [Deltaproteobacteria bacterium SG8_13]
MVAAAPFRAVDRSAWTASTAFICLHGLIAFWIWGCGPKMDHYQQLDQHVYHHQYDAALQLMQASREGYQGRNEALFYMEEGLLAHFAGRYRESIDSLLKAESILDELYTRSISKQAASFVFNDNTIPYRGEDFEDAMVNLYLALNFAALGATEDALVEARQVDNELNLINSRYDEDQKNVYREDAFIRFLMGVLYESGKEINDAFISYRKSEEIYRNDYATHYRVSAPRFLIENLLASASALGFDAEIKQIRQRYPDVEFPRLEEKNDRAEIFIIHYNGIGPSKMERQWLIPMPDGYMASIAYPVFEEKPYRISSGIVHLQNVDGNRRFGGQTELMEDIGFIAVQNLENRISRIKAKAITRATSKYMATKAASKAANDQAGELAGLLVQVAGNIAAAATERADVRHWRMLPDEIRVARMLIPPGLYDGQIDFVDATGKIVQSTTLSAFAVSSGEKKFLFQRTMQ